MSHRACLAAFLVLAGSVSAHAADLTKLERRIVKEPAYKTKSPRYALLVFGPEARDRVWIVKDGDTLYVDRNGNGDLTDPGEKVAANEGGSAEDGYSFEVDELNVGGKKHTYLYVGVAATKRPNAEAVKISLAVAAPHLKAEGRVNVHAGPIDLGGPLVMAAKAAEAPIVHFGGPLAVTFGSNLPALRCGRTTECTLVVGTPGLGSGTFATIGYDGVIPESVHPTVEVTYPPAKAGSTPVKQLYELKNRC